MEVVTAETKKGKQLIKRFEVKDSPFVIVKIEKEYFGTMGKYRITESHKNKVDVEIELEKITWNRLIQVVLLLIESTKENKL